MHRLIVALGFASLIVSPAHAESIRQQIIGAWTLTEGAEQWPDGKKIPYWNSGQMIFDASGRYALMLFKDRPDSEGMSDPRYPVGPMVAQFGSYRVDEETKRVTYHMDNSSTPALNGKERSQSIQVNGDAFITTSPPVKTPQGEVIAVNQWRRVKE